MTKYGFLGLGIMGKAMAANLLQAGLPLTVWNRSTGKADSLISQGAKLAQSPAEVVAESDITLAMVADPEASLALCFGKDSVLDGMAPGKGYVDISTVSPATVVRIAKAVTAAGGRYLEAPVSGSKKPAEDGTLVFLCGGDEQLYNDAGPAFDVMGKKSFFFGEAGNGAKTKLIVNMIMGTMLTALGEGLALSRQSGLNPDDLLTVLTEGAMDNPMFRLKGPQMVQQQYPTAFPLKHMQKDLRLALQLADDCRQPLATVASTNNLFLRALQKGYGEADTGAVFEAISDSAPKAPGEPT